MTSRQSHEAGAWLDDVIPAFDERGRPVRISVLTREGCHLCDRAVGVIEIACAESGVGYAPVDVDAQQGEAGVQLLRRYGDLLPVIFVDGRAHDYWAIDLVRLRTALEVR